MKTENQKKVIRTFSEELKRKIVSEIEQGKLTPTEVSRCYNVRRSNVYKWIDRYAQETTPSERLVLECDSDTQKAISLQARVSELERALGRKQLELQFHQELIALAEKHYGVDLKKISEPNSSNTSAISHSGGSR